MSLTIESATVNAAFFQPLNHALIAATHTRPCQELPDETWLRLGVQRVLEASPSGRAFLQEQGLRFAHTPEHHNYFASLKSERRGELLREVNLALLRAVRNRLPDRLADIPELAGYECFAADGHWHRAAAHDCRHAGTKMAVGHFYRLHLRTHTLRHLAAGAGLHEHDTSALKRITPKGLRQGVATGQRVLMIYDRGAIDLHYWQRCRRECAVYFLSRVKAGMVFSREQGRAWGESDRRNRGVISDWEVTSRSGHRLRIITYLDAPSAQLYEFLTNEPDLAPGILVELYRRRWEIEKVFDEVKNKLGQVKAWASGLTAKTAQAQFIVLTHNLLVSYEYLLKQRHGVTNQAERTNDAPVAPSLPGRRRVGAAVYAAAPLSEPDRRVTHPALWMIAQ